MVVVVQAVGVHPQGGWGQWLVMMVVVLMINMPASCLMPLLCHQMFQFFSGGIHIMGKGGGAGRKGVGSSSRGGGRWSTDCILLHHSLRQPGPIIGRTLVDGDSREEGRGGEVVIGGIASTARHRMRHVFIDHM